MQTLYTAHGSATGGREGHGATPDHVVDVKLTTPKELGGNGATGTNPEQLFAIGYSACFIGAMKFVAARRRSRSRTTSRWSRPSASVRAMTARASVSTSR